MGNFDIADLALQAVAPGNKLLYDDKGLPSVMVYIPKFKLSEVLTGGPDTYHPAFIINGSVVDGIWIGKYQATIEEGRAYSLPGKDPAATINFDNFLARCGAKGAGWHMMTAAEWGMIALWCKKHGIFPKGNNNYGKDSTESAYTAIPATYGTGTDAGKIYHVLTGTGPLTWSHDGTMKGIWDLNGNVAEWKGGFRTVKGELQFLANNNAADNSKSQAANSAEWKALDASTGEFVTPNGSGTTTNTVKVDCISNKPKYGITVTTTSENFNGAIHEITCTSDISSAAKIVLRAYGLLAEDGATAADYGDGDRLYFNNVADERMAYGGGYCSIGAYAGVFFSFGFSRTSTSTFIGLRVAYADLPTA